MGKKPSCTPELRRVIQTFKDAGLTNTEIARRLNCSRHMVSNAIQYITTYNTTEKVGRKLRPRKTTFREDNMIFRMVKANPFASSAEIKQQLGIGIAASTIRRRLNEYGLKGCIPCKKPLVSKRNRVKRLSFANEHINKDLQFWKILE